VGAFEQLAARGRFGNRVSITPVAPRPSTVPPRYSDRTGQTHSRQRWASLIRASQESIMETGTVIAIIVAIIIVGAIVAFVLSRSGARRTEADRAKAAEIREQADQHDRELREREASAAETKARAEMARVEAQKRELEAERLAAEADSRSESAAAVRQERDEQLRRADRRDPDVLTDKEGYRIDEHGNRIGDGQLGDERLGDGAVDPDRDRGDMTGTRPVDDRVDGVGERGDGLADAQDDRRRSSDDVRNDPYEEGYEEGRADVEERRTAGPRDGGM
jgi:hypothetical protein